MMNIELLRFWFVLILPMTAYLVTDRQIKAIYLTPAAWLAVDLLRSRFEYRIGDKAALRALLLYALILAMSLGAALTLPNQRVLLRDVLIIASPFLMFLNFADKPHYPSRFLFLPFVVTCIWAFYQGFGTFDVGNFRLLNLFLPSQVQTENNFGVICGLFTLHFLMTRRWSWFAASLVVSLWVSKRTLVLGLAMGILYWLALGLTRGRFAKARPLILFLMYVGFGAGAVFLVEIGDYFLSVLDLADLKLSRFLMGRDNLLLTLRENTFDLSLSGFFGHGPGAADSYLAFRGSNWGPVTDVPFNPHNDHMKLIYDYGYVGYLLFFFVLHTFYASTRRGEVLLVYTMTVFCFDNALIFIIYSIVAGFLVSELRLDEKDWLDR